MNLGNILNVILAGGAILAEVEGDVASLQPGNTSTFPCSIQVGTHNGKAVRLTAISLTVAE